ncbi:Lysine transporter LysE [Candidatus Desulfarcum epimagneticum]|uniref:Lysine transporter LysE n=1 Tax=uncultured Desulfobacteraceae bacterium TaxID=218296 RepID=A0A484HJ33_9BACT|nr:Lysine transporter LysE [uncultured Desulfobacteraceae bacterium]
MTLELWIPFALAAALVLIIPGPTVILVVSQALSHGRRSVAPLAAGVVLGDFTAMTLSLLGLGALLSASAALFTLFKWAGALFLIFLGIRMIVSSPRQNPAPGKATRASGRSLFKSSFVTTALNPKSIAFFVAFLPQFMDPLKPALAQMTTLGATFLFLAGVNAALFAFFAGRLGEQMRKKSVRKWLNRLGGSALIGAGILTAGMRRAP